MSEHFEEIVVADKVEPRESSTLALEVLAKRRLDPVQELGEALERVGHVVVAASAPSAAAVRTFSSTRARFESMSPELLI